MRQLASLLHRFRRDESGAFAVIFGLMAIVLVAFSGAVVDYVSMEQVRNRAQIALSDYREVPALEEALYIMVKSYDALGLTQLRDDAQRVLTTNYPQSDYMAKGFRSKDDPWWKLW